MLTASACLVALYVVIYVQRVWWCLSQGSSLLPTTLRMLPGSLCYMNW
jgi:hypothetical protein